MIIFRLLQFVLLWGVLGYGLFTHNLSLIVGVLCGFAAAVVELTIKKYNHGQ